MKYHVYIDDNFHHGDESERLSAGGFETLEEAIARARAIVEESLTNLREPGMTTDRLLAQYALFGDDPFIIGPASDASTGPLFSARNYARTIAGKVEGQK